MEPFLEARCCIAPDPYMLWSPLLLLTLRCSFSLLSVASLLFQSEQVWGSFLASVEGNAMLSSFDATLHRVVVVSVISSGSYGLNSRYCYLIE